MRYLLSVIHEAASSLGQIIDSPGCRVDPDKVKAIVEMKRPDDISGICRFVGMVNQLNKFSPKITELRKCRPCDIQLLETLQAFLTCVSERIR
jgi:hypothetical protein